MSFQGFNIVNTKIIHFLSTFGFSLHDKSTQEMGPSESSHFLKSVLRTFITPPLCTLKTVSDINGTVTQIKVKRGNQVIEYHRTNRSATESFGAPSGDLHGLFPTVKDFVQFAEGRSLLDIGCGGGALVFELRKKGVTAFGVDLCLTNEQEDSLAFVQGDAFALPFLNDSFDLLVSVWSVFSYEPMTKLRPLLSEAYRVLKPDGMMILSPIMDEEKLILLQKWSRQVGAKILIDKKTHAVLIKK